MLDKIRTKVAREFAAIDLSEENEEIANIEARIAEAHLAIVAADDRRRAIVVSIEEAQGPRGDDVADALLNGADVTVAARIAPGIEALKAERDSLHAGIRELNRRVEDWRADIAQVENAAGQKIAPATLALIDALKGEATTACERLREIHASLAAIGAATRFGGHACDGIAQTIKAACEGASAIMQWRREVDVPAEIVAVLEHLQGKGRSLRAHVPDQIRM